MNKILKNSCYAMIALLSTAFTACTDDYDYDPAPVENDGAYILADETELILGENDQQQLSFTVTRHDKTQAKTYKLYSSDANVPVPSEVSFAEGEEYKTFTVNFNVPVGTIEKQVVIGVEDEDAYIYGAHSQTYTISRCKALPDGSSIYSDWFGGKWYIDIYEYGTSTDEETGVKTVKFLVKDPFYVSPQVGLGNGTGYNFVFTINSKNKAAAAQQSICEYEGGMDITAKGNGTYFPGYNYVQFLWSMDVPDLGGGFGSFTHIIYFPGGYDPLQQ